MQATSGQLQDHQGIRTGVDAIGSFPIPRRQDNTVPVGLCAARFANTLFAGSKHLEKGGGVADRVAFTFWFSKHRQRQSGANLQLAGGNDVNPPDDKMPEECAIGSWNKCLG
jgi:hypothetical protein